ncbi:MAG: hypothetical protein L3J75_17280 [Methylococcaceae bacterium]|nr:hypothetical protein [Methylococcaceae bacterium]
MKIKIKIKTMSQTIAILMLSSLLISCFDKKDSANSTQRPVTPEQASKRLNVLGKRLATGPISKIDEALITKLAPIKIPSPILIKNNVVLATGINHVNNNFFVLNPRTGQEVNSCGKLTPLKNKNLKICNITIIEPSDALRNVISISAPLDGKIVKEGEEGYTDIKFFVTVTAVYDGSDCTTTIANGDGTETCSQRPNRRR